MPRPPYQRGKRGGFGGQRGGHAPYRRPQGRATVECYECGKQVGDLKKHKRETHAKKYWGYMCPRCGHFEGEGGRSLMIKHIDQHRSGISIDQCAKNVAEGYSVPARCLMAGCHFKAPTPYLLGMHAAVVHRPGALVLPTSAAGSPAQPPQPVPTPRFQIPMYPPLSLVRLPATPPNIAALRIHSPKRVGQGAGTSGQQSPPPPPPPRPPKDKVE